MKKTIENMLIAVQNPQVYEGDFGKALGIDLAKHGVELGVPKTFAGDAYATQELSVVGEKKISFANMANGATQFPQGEHFLCGYLRIYTGANATLGATDWIAGTDTAELKNCKINIVNNGTRIYKNIPLLEMTRSEEQNDSGYLVFTTPFWWLAQTDLEIELISPVDLAVANQNVRFELSGSKYIS